MGNKLIPIIFVALLCIVVLIVGLSSQSNEAKIPEIDQGEETTGSADADTTVNTLETLVARIEAGETQRTADRALMLELQEQLSQQNASIDLIEGDQTSFDTSDLESNITAQVLDEIGKLKPNQGGDGSWGSDFDEFNGDLDIGNGFSPSHSGTDAGGSSQIISNSSSNMVVLGAVTIQTGPSKSAVSKDRDSVQEYIGDDSSEIEEDFSLDSDGKTDTASEGVPVYTIPQLAMDVSAETLTAVIGRIPNGGEVRDPFYFKVLSSADIITANGHNLPQLEGIIWEGTALGDRTLGCIQGTITKVSLILADGSIAETNVGGSESGSGSNEGLGYITDRYGQPCLPGKLISNAGKLLFARVAASAIEAAAGAEAARQETTTQSGTTDSTSTSVTGSRSQYIKAKTASGGLSELVKFTRERMRDTFDAIYAEPGVPVQVHLRQRIEFNFNEKGRRLVHNFGGIDNANYLAD